MAKIASRKLIGEVKKYLKAIPKDSKEFEEALAQIYTGSGGMYDEVIASHRELPTDILNELVKSKRESVRVKVATNPKLSVKQIQELSTDVLSVRRSLATNTGRMMRKSKIFYVLSKDKELSVRERVARNKTTPEDILSELAKDDSTAVRLQVAMNIHTNVATLESLEKDSIAFVARKASETLLEKNNQ